MKPLTLLAALLLLGLAAALPARAQSVGGGELCITGALPVSGHIVTWSGSNCVQDGGNPAGTGTVTSVGVTGPGGIVSVTGSPIASSGTISFAWSGAAGGIPYFSTATNLASSASIAGLVVGNGTSAPTAYGGVTGVAHEWISALSASGVGTLTQPAFSDISGAASLAQLPSAPANSLLGAVTAGAPSYLSAPSCSASGNALNFTSGTGLGCVTLSTITGVTAGTGLSGGGSTGSLTLSLSAPVSANLGGTGLTSVTAFGVPIGEGTGAFHVIAPAADSILGWGAATADPTAEAVPNCTDSSGAHLNYSTATHAWSCGNTSSGGAPTTLNRITTGTSNTLSALTTPFTTEVWVSATTGNKTDSIPGCVTGLNTDYLMEVDVEGNAATYPITITPASGTIGNGGSSYKIFVNGGAALFQCDGSDTQWHLVSSPPGGSNVNYQTGTSYAIQPIDNGSVIDVKNAAAISLTIAQATAANGFPPGGFYTLIRNSGGSTATLTPTTSTINGAASISITGGNALMVSADDAGNYEGVPIAGSGSGGGITCPIGFSVSGANCVWTIATSGSPSTLSWTGLSGDNYDLKCFGLVASASTTWDLQYGESTGPTWETSGYQWGAINTGFGGAVTSANSTTAAGAYEQTSMTNIFALDTQLFGLGKSVQHHAITQATIESGSTYYQQDENGYYSTDTSAITGLRLTLASGTFNSGGQCTLYALGD